MVGHLGVFVKVLYFVQAFISKVGLRNVLGTISEFSVRSHFLGVFDLSLLQKKNSRKSVSLDPKRRSRKSGSTEHKRRYRAWDQYNHLFETKFFEGVTN